MINSISELWYAYQLEKTAKLTGEEKEILNILVSNQKELYNKLDQEQKELLEKYIENVHELGCVSEKNAFICGVRFATTFLFDALSEEHSK